MELTVRIPIKIEAKAIRVVAPVRYGEEDIPKDFPFRQGDLWDVTIDIDTGKIRDWPKGREENIAMKLVDEGNYYLLGDDGRELAKCEGSYVPSCIPGRFGDYIDFRIDGEGVICGWCICCDENTIVEAFFPTEE
jgi:hypothetical protein